MAGHETRSEKAERLATSLRVSRHYRWIGIYDVTPDEVILLGASDGLLPAYPRFSRDVGLTSVAIATGKPVLSNDVTADARYLTAFESTGSELIVPIRDKRNRVVGTLDVESAQRDAFGSGEIENVAEFAASVAPLFTEFIVRIAEPGDAAALAEIYAWSVEHSAASFEEVAPSAEEMGERLRETLQWTPWLAAASGAEVIGYAYASRHRERAAYRWSVDTSVYVHERFRGRGVGSKLYTELFAILERQGFRRAYCGVALPNEASVAVHRAAGFEPVGVYRRVGWKFNAWHDTAWFGRDLPGDEADPPKEPIPFPILRLQYDLER